MDKLGYHTEWVTFVAIVIGYLVLSLVIGGKKTYFDRFEEPKEEEPSA